MIFLVERCLTAQISKKKYKSMSECKNLVDEALDRIRECTESCTDELQKKTIAVSKIFEKSLQLY